MEHKAHGLHKMHANRETMPPIMKPVAVLTLKFFARTGSVGVLLLTLLPAWAQLPKRNLTVELRQIEEVVSTGYAAGTQSGNALLTEQIVKVRNGEKASLRMLQSMPMQWLQSASASRAGGGVTHAMVWLQAGQSLTVQPSWPGGQQLAVVDIEVQSSRINDQAGTALPAQSSSQLATTVSVPLGRWVNIASSGSSPPGGVYSSEAGNSGRRLLQIRVMAP